MARIERDEREIFGIGITGLVGSRIAELLSHKYSFRNLSLETGVDIRKPETLEVIRNDTGQSVILHLAAKTDVDGCEMDKPFEKEGDAWKINVEGTRNVVGACLRHRKRIVYVSTDFVYDGEWTPADGYDEEESPHPSNWYGETKFQGEEVVRSSGLPFLIIRIAYPYRAKFDEKKDFIRAIAARLANGEEVSAVTDHIMTPTFIDDIAWGFDRLLEEEATGIYHVVGSQFITPYDCALSVAETFGFDTKLIKKTTREEYFKGRAPHPFNLSLKNDKIQKLGIRMKTFEEGLEEIKRQIALR